MADTKPGAHTEQPAGHKGGFPPFQADTFASQLLWFALAFGGLYILMTKIALPRVGAIIDGRQAKITGDLDSAASAQKQADDAAKAYEKTLADAKGRAQAMGQEAAAKATAETEARRKTLESDLNAKLASAEAQIATMKSQAMANVDGIASEAAASIVRQLTGKAPAADAIARALAAAKA